MRFDKKPLDFTVHKDHVWSNFKKQYLKHLAKFIGEVTLNGNVRVYGRQNYRLYEKLAEELSLNIRIKNADYVFAFDVIESLVDPQITLYNIGKYAKNDARIFITCPHRAWASTWSHNHWHEIGTERFKWLVNHCGFKIVRDKKVVIWDKWYKYFGFRPILRLLFSRYHIHMYELRIK